MPVSFQQRLLRWFARHQRDLPWRHNRDPYPIWISEAMLQQTQVATVIPYFQRFLTAFPTLADLAAADEQAVLRLWEGLGYYRRARHLHQAARTIVADHGGAFPRDPAACAALPGVGRYMVGAILSQAFDQRLPIVEANTKRVLCRLFGHTGDPASGPTQRWLWEQAAMILPARRAGDFNQALMELGALVCTPRAPACDECPLARDCAAHRQGIVDQIPPPPAPPRIEQVREAAVVLRRGARVLLVQRPDGGRWAGMWEFPHSPLAAAETADAAAARLVAELTGLRVGPLTELQTIRHGVTRFRITMICFETRCRAGAFTSDFYRAGRWLEPAELGAYPISRPQRQLADDVSRGGRAARLF